jgi:hypothetical protein
MLVEERPCDGAVDVDVGLATTISTIFESRPGALKLSNVVSVHSTTAAPYRFLTYANPPISLSRACLHTGTYLKPRDREPSSGPAGDLLGTRSERRSAEGSAPRRTPFLPPRKGAAPPVHDATVLEARAASRQLTCGYKQARYRGFLGGDKGSEPRAMSEHLGRGCSSSAPCAKARTMKHGHRRLRARQGHSSALPRAQPPPSRRSWPQWTCGSAAKRGARPEAALVGTSRISVVSRPLRRAVSALFGFVSDRRTPGVYPERKEEATFS